MSNFRQNSHEWRLVTPPWDDPYEVCIACGMRHYGLRTLKAMQGSYRPSDYTFNDASRPQEPCPEVQP